MFKHTESYGLTAQFLQKTVKYVVLLAVCFFFVFLLGTDLLESVIDDPGSLHHGKDLLFFTELVLVFTAYLLLMIRFLRKQQKYIAYLIDSIKLMRGGNFGRPTEILGNNELSSLATYIDELRKTVSKDRRREIVKKEKEQQLITAISHDLRTPLTALIGYLEILQDEDFTDAKKRKSYLDHCMDRALQLQALTDTAFEHFYLSTKGKRDIELLRCNSYINLLAIMEKRIEALENIGYHVSFYPPACQYSLVYDTRMMERLFDNIFSNIVRYADIKQTITMEGTCTKERLMIVVRNGIGVSNPKSQSTGIGLKNCQQIMKIHGGKFSSEVIDHDYSVKIHFPIQNEV